MGSVYLRLGVGLHINIYGTADSQDLTGTALPSIKAYLAPTFTVNARHWILKWETNMFFEICVVLSAVDFRVMSARLNIADRRVHGPRVLWGQCAVRWPGQRQQAIVWSLHVRVSIRGQVLYHHRDLSSVFAMRKHYNNFFFLLISKLIFNGRLLNVHSHRSKNPYFERKSSVLQFGNDLKKIYSDATLWKPFKLKFQNKKLHVRFI